MSIKSPNLSWILAVATLLAGMAIGYSIAHRATGENLADPNAFDNLKSREPGWRPIDCVTANDEMDAFRQNLAFLNLSLHSNAKSKCIVHDSTSAIKYSTEFFPQWVTTHNCKAGFKWAIGLYPEVCREPVAGGSKAKPRISIFMIPTMQSTTDPKTVIDYMDARLTCDSMFYIPKDKWPKQGESRAATPLSANNDFIYDQGTIFP